MTIWITSDTHFGHANILKYCNRSFANIEEHDNALINAWNSVVKQDDEVFHLGDFTLAGTEFAEKMLRRLNGRMFLLLNRWHHDKRWIYGVDDTIFDFMPSIVVMDINDIKNSMPIVMCHYPLEVWDRKHYGAIHFHGHSHGFLRRIHNRLDIGVDVAHRILGSYRPFSLHEATSFANGYYEENYNGRDYDVSKSKE